MMNRQWLEALSRYNRWMNDKLYGLAASMSEEERKRDVRAFFRSIHGTFNHLLVADRIWLARISGAEIPDGYLAPGIRSLDQELYSDFDQLREQRARTDDDLSAWVGELTPERLAGTFVAKRHGAMQELPLWEAVVHIFNHQTHHRGQITTVMTQMGYDPGVTDLFAMLREEATPRVEASTN